MGKYALTTPSPTIPLVEWIAEKRPAPAKIGELETSRGHERRQKMTHLTGHYVRAWRKSRGISARELGEALGYRGREYIKKLEGGYFPMTEKFARRFDEFKHKTQAREYRQRKIESLFPLPKTIRILARPRRCAICREWFIFADHTQKVCNARTCRRAYAAKATRTRSQHRKAAA